MTSSARLALILAASLGTATLTFSGSADACGSYTPREPSPEQAARASLVQYLARHQVKRATVGTPQVLEGDVAISLVWLKQGKTRRRYMARLNKSDRGWRVVSFRIAPKQA